MAKPGRPRKVPGKRPGTTAGTKSQASPNAQPGTREGTGQNGNPVVGQRVLEEQDELQKLASEAAAADPASPKAAGQESGPTKPADAQKADEGLVIVMSQFVAVVGLIACKRFEVPPLDKDEIEALGQASGQVASFYMPKDINPRAAAWIGLGMVTTAVIAKRVDFSPNENPEPPVADTAKDDDAPVQPAPKA